MEDGGVFGDGGADEVKHKEQLAEIDLSCILKKIMNENNELANDNRGQHIKKRVMGKILFNSI